MAEDMMKQNVENKSPQLNQTGKKSKLFLLKENKGFYLLLENFLFYLFPSRAFPIKKTWIQRKSTSGTKKVRALFWFARIY